MYKLVTFWTPLEINQFYLNGCARRPRICWLNCLLSISYVLEYWAPYRAYIRLKYNSNCHLWTSPVFSPFFSYFFWQTDIFFSFDSLSLTHYFSDKIQIDILCPIPSVYKTETQLIHYISFQLNYIITNLLILNRIPFA